MSKKAKTLLKCGIALGVCILFTAVYLLNMDYAEATQAQILGTVSDAFSMPGLLLILFGGLLFVSNEGAFLGVGYALSIAFKALVPGGRLKMETYADYVERKSGKRVDGYGFLFAVGGVWLAIGLILAAVTSLY